MSKYQLILGDCVSKMKEMDDNTIDLTVTSPPYDSLRTYEKDIDKTWGEHIWKPCIEQLYRITKDGGVVVWVVGDATVKGSETGTSFKQALYAMECGFNLHDTMIWKKPNPLPSLAKNRYTGCFEYMFIWSKGIPSKGHIKQIPTKNAGKPYRVRRNNATSNGGGGVSTKDKVYVTKDTRNDFNIWEVCPESSKNYLGHPAIFPEKLAEDHILSWSNEGDVILDCFAGSGTTGKMALLNNRNFIGIELNDTYIKIAEERLNNVLK